MAFHQQHLLSSCFFTVHFVSERPLALLRILQRTCVGYEGKHVKSNWLNIGNKIKKYHSECETLSEGKAAFPFFPLD